MQAALAVSPAPGTTPDAPAGSVGGMGVAVRDADRILDSFAAALFARIASDHVAETPSRTCHRGRISVGSSPLGGAEFRITFPPIDGAGGRGAIRTP